MCIKSDKRTVKALEAQLVRTFEDERPALLKRIGTLVRSREDAEDAVQTAFLRCWLARQDLAGVRSLRHWIWGVALNVARDLRDYQGRRRMPSLDMVEEMAAASTSPCDLAAQREETEVLGKALDVLRSEEKDVFLLRFSEDCSYDEIARRRGIPIGTAKTRMHKAMGKLRQAVAREVEPFPVAVPA
jgi:RNA polymerase sigma-70 factor (ECF subfamily)